MVDRPSAVLRGDGHAAQTFLGCEGCGQFVNPADRVLQVGFRDERGGVNGYHDHFGVRRKPAVRAL